jgi:type I site-specific restriction endonuclease
MIALNFPEPSFRFRQSGDQQQIFDELRQKWIALQPEEWVRQNIINWLIKEQKVPSSFIAVEKTLSAEKNAMRFDLLIYDRSHQPWMIIECKAPAIKLDEKVLMQVLSYNIKLPVPFLMITNGTACHIANKKAEQTQWCSAFPAY